MKTGTIGLLEILDTEVNWFVSEFCIKPYYGKLTSEFSSKPSTFEIAYYQKYLYTSLSHLTVVRHLGFPYFYFFL